MYTITFRFTTLCPMMRATTDDIESRYVRASPAFDLDASRHIVLRRYLVYNEGLRVVISEGLQHHATHKVETHKIMKERAWGMGGRVCPKKRICKNRTGGLDLRIHRSNHRGDSTSPPKSSDHRKAPGGRQLQGIASND